MHIIRSETLGRRLASAKSLAKSLAESLTKSLAETISETLDETFGETLGDTFRARQAPPQSLGSDYMHGSTQDSLRDSFFLRGEAQHVIKLQECNLALKVGMATRV